MINENALDIGIYSISEAARLLDLPEHNARQWVIGRDYNYRQQKKWSAPLWQREYGSTSKRLGFRDLMQLRIVRRLVQASFSIQTLRTLITHASEVLQSAHPLVTARFRTDGRSLFLAIADQVNEQDEKERIYDLDRRQYAFSEVMKPSFIDVDFLEDEIHRWWPMGKSSPVLLDPRYAFGVPVTAIHHVPVNAILEALSRNQAIEEVASLYEIDVTEVEAAAAMGPRVLH